MCVLNFANLRYNLHKRAYQHRVARIVEEMMTEVLVLAEPYLMLPGTNGKLYVLSQRTQSPPSLMVLTSPLLGNPTVCG